MRLFLSLLVVWGFPASAAETMRIAMGKEVPRAIIRGQQLALGDDAEDGHFVGLDQPEVQIEAVKDGLKVAGAAWPEQAVRVRTGQSSSDGLPLVVNGTAVRGDVVAVRTPQGVQLVNVLPLEDYLVGVLGSEMPRSYPLEALKAQAVAARTYALHRKLEQYGQSAHLGSSVLSQVYGGLKAEDPRTREAVEATRGLVLTYDLQPIEAYFHASCGGETETGLSALNRDLPYLKAVDCPCHSLKETHWSALVDDGELQRALGLKGAAAVEVQGRTGTGRARRVAVGARSIDAVQFRERLGYSRVRSLRFEVEKKGKGWLIEGDGFGHGAGMCQWGARLYAEKGWRFAQILAHYYPGAELQTLY